MKVAFLFPGQDVELSRVGTDLVKRSSLVNDLVKLAAKELGLTIVALFNQAGRSLERTEVCQPILTGLTLGVHLELVTAGVRPNLVAGHSLGEIAAWSAANCIEPGRAVTIATRRGSLMGQKAREYPGGMLALVDCQKKCLKQALALGGQYGSLHLAAINAPDEFVVSGDFSALKAIASRFKSVPLNVSGPWHSSAMIEAVEPLRQAMKKLTIRPPEVDFISNRTGKVVENYEQFPDLLSEQLVNPVAWAATMETLKQAGITDVVTIGPGKALRGLIRKNRVDVQVHATHTIEHLEATIRKLSK